MAGRNLDLLNKAIIEGGKVIQVSRGSDYELTTGMEIMESHDYSEAPEEKIADVLWRGKLLTNDDDDDGNVVGVLIGGSVSSYAYRVARRQVKCGTLEEIRSRGQEIGQVLGYQVNRILAANRANASQAEFIRIGIADMPERVLIFPKPVSRR